MHWNTAPVDDDDNHLAFIDSGPPSNSSAYTTLVLVHGHSYHAPIFKRLLPLAEHHNLRIVAPNRRDYVNSTLFTQAELDAISGTDSAAHVDFLRARGLELARFLIWVVNNLGIPPASADGKEGGLALAGWSAGNLTTLAFLRHLNTYPEEVVDVLRPFLRTFFVYEVAYSNIGYPRPDLFYHPLLDPSVPERLRGITFGLWVSSYCSHPYYTEPGKHHKAMTSLQLRTPDSPVRQATLETIDPVDLMESVDTGPGNRSERPFYSIVSDATLHDQFVGSVLVGGTDGQSATLLPELKVHFVYCTQSVWSIPWGVWELEKELAKWEREGRRTRPFSFIRVDDANHFLHWDDPEIFITKCAEGIRS